MQHKSDNKEKAKGRGRPRIHKNPVAIPVVFERETIDAIKRLGVSVSVFIRESTIEKLARTNK